MWEDILKEKDDYGDSPESIVNILIGAVNNAMDSTDKAVDIVQYTQNPDVLKAADRLTTLFYDLEEELKRFIKAFEGDVQ